MVAPTSTVLNRRGRSSARAGVASTVLLVAAEPTLRELLVSDLRRAGLQPLPATNAAQAQRLLEHVVPDVLLVDQDDVPDARAAWQWAPAGAKRVLLSRDPDCRRGDCGADLCLLKPIQSRALVLAIVRLLRPARPSSTARARPPLVLPGIQIERSTPSVRIQPAGADASEWKSLDLPDTEHRLLVALAEAAPRGLTREQLRQGVWGDDLVSLRSVDQYVRRLRARLAPLGGRELVHTVRSFGYRFEPDAISGA
jgi:two-component system, OmpR family, phosphate regulon response regulator PhoB